MSRREELFPEIRRLREDEGRTWREIGERFGLSLKTVHDYYTHPSAESDHARREKYTGTCTNCGARTNNGGCAGGPPALCARCNGVKMGRANKVWTRERIVAAIREWAEVHGEPPRSCDWNPTAARLLGRRVHPAYIDEPERWPHKLTVMKTFGQPGGWARAIREAGFTQRKQGETDAALLFPERMAQAVALVGSGLTQAETARQLGLTSTTVWRYMSLAREQAAA